MLNGGYLIVRNYDTGEAVIDPKQYYTGTELLHTANFTFDFVRPYHCSVGSEAADETPANGCVENMLDRKDAITKEVRHKIQITNYEIEAYKMMVYCESIWPSG